MRDEMRDEKMIEEMMGHEMKMVSRCRSGKPAAPLRHLGLLPLALEDLHFAPKCAPAGGAPSAYKT